MQPVWLVNVRSRSKIRRAATPALSSPITKTAELILMPDSTFQIAVLAGDGIGHEITPPTLDLLSLACSKVSTGGNALSLTYKHLEAGADTYQKTGVALPDETVEQAGQSDAILLACMGDPAVRYPDGTEIVPQVELRFRLGLFAGLRPVRSIPGVPVPLADPRFADVDFVLVRESIEGLFAPDRPGARSDTEATEILLITREVSEKLFKHVFALAEQRKTTGRPGRVTCVDKANIFPAFAFFRDLFNETASNHPHLQTDHAYVDAMAMHMVSRPWDYDVLVTENMFGDILSDLGAALMGGMGYAPSADIGEDNAVFQPCHGTAPDIAGSGIANPTAMILSGAMMLDWLGQRHNNAVATAAGKQLVDAVDRSFSPGTLRTCELGGDAGVDQVVQAVRDQLEAG